jgi:hypothetical protein
MSSANVDLVRSIYERWARGDFSDVAWADAAIEFMRIDGGQPIGRDWPVWRSLGAIG